jgi:amino acid permease
MTFESKDEKKAEVLDLSPTETNDVGEITVYENADALHRKLGNRQIQLIAIGMTIYCPRHRALPPNTSV